MAGHLALLGVEQKLSNCSTGTFLDHARRPNKSCKEERKPPVKSAHCCALSCTHSGVGKLNGETSSKDWDTMLTMRHRTSLGSSMKMQYSTKRAQQVCPRDNRR